MDKIFQALQEQGVNPALLDAIMEFRGRYPADEKHRERITFPELAYYGRETFEMAAAALLQG